MRITVIPDEAWPAFVRNRDVVCYRGIDDVLRAFGLYDLADEARWGFTDGNNVWCRRSLLQRVRWGSTRADRELQNIYCHLTQKPAHLSGENILRHALQVGFDARAAVPWLRWRDLRANWLVEYSAWRDREIRRNLPTPYS